MIRALAFFALLAVAQVGAAPSSGSNPVKVAIKNFSKAAAASLKTEEFLQALDKYGEDRDRRSLAEDTLAGATCKSIVKTFTSGGENMEQELAFVSLSGLPVMFAAAFECPSETNATACAALTNCTMLTDYDETPATTECSMKPSLTSQKMQEAGMDAGSVTFFKISGQVSECEQITAGKTQCEAAAGKKCEWDEKETPAKCNVDTKWTFLTLANGCPSEAGNLEKFISTGGYTLKGIAAEKGVALDATAAANAAAVSSGTSGTSNGATSPRAASLILAAVVAAAAFLLA